MPLQLYKMTMAQIPKGPASRKYDFLVKIIKIITDVGIMKFFSWQTVYTYYE